MDLLSCFLLEHAYNWGSSFFFPFLFSCSVNCIFTLINNHVVTYSMVEIEMVLSLFYYLMAVKTVWLENFYLYDHASGWYFWICILKTKPLAREYLFPICNLSYLYFFPLALVAFVHGDPWIFSFCSWSNVKMKFLGNCCPLFSLYLVFECFCV